MQVAEVRSAVSDLLSASNHWATMNNDIAQRVKIVLFCHRDDEITRPTRPICPIRYEIFHGVNVV